MMAKSEVYQETTTKHNRYKTKWKQTTKESSQRKSATAEGGGGKERHQHTNIRNMLQPTSCGPGPPDEILEFNCNELRDNVCLFVANNRQDYKISRVAKDVPAEAHNLEEVEDIDNTGGRVNDERSRARVFNQYVMSHNITTSSNTTTNNSSRSSSISHKNYNDNNNNCHLKKIKFYVNNTTVAVPAAEVPSTFFSSKRRTRATPGAAGFVSCHITKSWLQHCCSLVTAVATIANNFNKTWCGSNFLSSSISTKWILMFLMLFGILAQTPHQVAAEKSKHCKYFNIIFMIVNFKWILILIHFGKKVLYVFIHSILDSKYWTNLKKISLYLIWKIRRC